MLIRPETPHDCIAIHELLRHSFPSESEAKLVDYLRADGDLTQSLIGEIDGIIVGYVALSRVQAPFPAEALAPVATHADFRANGHAAALIGSAIQRSQSDIIFVLGEPQYYTRFGFSLSVAQHFASPYSGPYFMALAKNDVPTGCKIMHAPAFSKL